MGKMRQIARMRGVANRQHRKRRGKEGGPMKKYHRRKKKLRREDVRGPTAYERKGERIIPRASKRRGAAKWVARSLFEKSLKGGEETRLIAS